MIMLASRCSLNVADYIGSTILLAHLLALLIIGTLSGPRWRTRAGAVRSISVLRFWTSEGLAKNIMLRLSGGILMSIVSSPDFLSQRILVGIILGRLGVRAHACRACGRTYGRAPKPPPSPSSTAMLIT